MSSSDATTPPVDADADEESYPIRPREVALFALFGLVPVVVLYLFASGSADDPRGRAFEQERRLLIEACMDQLDDRERCLRLIDERLLECYEPRADDEGVVADRRGLRRCITGRDDDKFR